MSHVRCFGCFPVALLCAALTGCQTDPLFEKQNQKVDAPLAPIDQPPGVEVPDINVVDSSEADLVEAVLTYRAQYARNLEALGEYYRSHGYYRKLKWAETEMADVRRIKPFKYILEAEVPSASLQPSTKIADADALYDKGLAKMKEGGHGTPVFYREKTMREAVTLFTDLINRYPNSDKIDDAAFQLGEIYKEYFQDQEEIALKWYQRALDWDPKTPYPVRFQSAVVTDYRLHDRARALELYHDVLKHETGNRSNTAFSVRRIGQLTKEMGGDVTGVSASASEPPIDMSEPVAGKAPGE
jgi:tetratricopeptide (TPR) repeat protein